jgi:hypothetical protein
VTSLCYGVTKPSHNGQCHIETPDTCNGIFRYRIIKIVILISISNISTSKLYLSFSNPATVANCFIEMQAGEFRLFDQQLIFGNTIYGIWASANGAAQVTEYV